MSLQKLAMQAHLLSLGYRKFETQEKFLNSSLKYGVASFQDKDTDPKIYEMRSENDTCIMFWDFLYSKICKQRAFGDDETALMPDLYINDDDFVIAFNGENQEVLIRYQEKNVFARPTIKNIDDRNDLGDINFIVTNAGLLFSFFKHPMPKVLDDVQKIIYLPFEVGRYKANNNVAYQIKKNIIGSYFQPYSIRAIHVFPKGDIFNPRIYSEWK